jgi:hypothetical protein
MTTKPGTDKDNAHAAAGRIRTGVLEHLLMVHVRLTGQNPADETATSPDAALIGGDIEWDALGHSPPNIM